MQIRNITLYKDANKKRILPFELGKVNIITGSSKSGKSALIDIIDYCLGSSDCKIADGVIKSNVYWFCLTVVFNDRDEYFIARQNPDTKDVDSISEIFLQKINNKTPEFDEITPNTNISGLKDFLSQKMGIAENLQISDNNTREPLEVNFKHSRFYSFQPQTMIAQRDSLFYKQTESFVSQSMKDSLPYLLGAIREDSLIIEQEIIQKKRELNRLIRDRNEANKIKSDGVSLAFSLIEEAKNFDIIDKKTSVTNIKEALTLLNSIKDWEYQSNISDVRGENSVLKDLILKRNEYKIELGKLDNTVQATETFIKNNFSYTTEIQEQQVRLECVNIYSEDVDDNTICPLCDNKLENPNPKVSAIKSSLSKLHNTMQLMTRESPRLDSYLQDLHNKQNQLKENIINTENSISALYEENAKERRLRDLNLRRGKVIGRISLFLESVDFSEDKSIDVKIKKLQSDIENLLSQVDKESKEDKLASIINKINLSMSMWVKDLDVEYENCLVRFDLPKLTLIADTANKSIPLSKMGSGANWVSYHLLIHFALHKHFIQANRPTPRFLVIDQPTQVYFPPEKDVNDDGQILESSDEIAVKQMFDFIIDVTNSFNSNFQVIITDHAYLQNDKFKACVREVWRDGTKLIPEDWIEK